MTKMLVLPGVWWVEIPEANLRILCGAPMDSIKHLIHMGLVKKIEKNGVVYEEGPNVILLSDLSVQRGRFWNLAEFPVLHMLYRQGMGIPGHPGNTGMKPILAGLSRQVNVTLSYIYRGTYGLVSKEEMRTEGIPEDQLEELWRLKLKFAPGGIKSPQELVDIKGVDRGPVGLPGNVTLSRDAVNQYTFTHNGESVSVDMNLPLGKEWSAPYTLNSVDTSQGYFSITHIGEGNGWDPNRPCMGSIVTFRGKKYLIDAGPGIDYSLKATGCDISEIKGLFITHVHDDHFAGLTCLLQGDWKVNIFATRPVMATVRYKCAALLEKEVEFLDAYVNIHYLEEGVWNDIDGLEVRPVMSPHSLETTIMFFRALWEGGYKSYAHLADIISDKVLSSFIAPDGVSHDFKKRVFEEYHQKVDIKKIDVGRGLIHGFAEDFINDQSGKIILSHTEGRLSAAEMKIGVSASFGQVDILIPDRGDRLRSLAERLLKRTITGLSGKDFNLLINGEIQTVPPKTPLLEQNSLPEYLALIITGTIDTSGNSEFPQLRLTPGSLLGEEEFLTKSPAKTTWISRNYVRLLRIPADLYVHAMNTSGNIEHRLKILETRRFFCLNQFPGAVVSCPRLDDLVAVAVKRTWKKGRRIRIGKHDVFILSHGSARALDVTGKKPGYMRKPGEWFYHSDFHWKAEEICQGFVLPGSILQEIPILGWTLAETIPNNFQTK